MKLPLFLFLMMLALMPAQKLPSFLYVIPSKWHHLLHPL